MERRLIALLAAADLKPQVSEEVYVESCTAHVNKVLAEAGMEFDEAMLQEYLQGFCQKNDSPNHNDGFKDYESCVDFSKKLAAERIGQLKGQKADYPKLCRDAYLHSSGSRGLLGTMGFSAMIAPLAVAAYTALAL
mmetsp:Transcript_19577/g.55192  ORF Transcript_19577/g.55192 Transcript_19577/m.55192 type:complete len:136 (+) Transcript_19577:164-571(+)